MGELSFLTIIVSLAVCSILVFAVYQYMKVRFTVLEHSQKEQALILQQYIEESSYDIQGLQSIVFRQRGGAGVQQQEHQAQMDASEPEEVYEDHNKHIHMDTVMYEAPNKPRSTLIAISSDSENTTSAEDSDGSDSGSSSGSSSDSSSDGSESDGSESDSDGSDDSEIESENVHMIHDIHEVKHIEISSTLDDHDHDHDHELEIESVTIIDEEPALALAPALALEPAPETKTITLDLGTSVDTDEHQLAESSTASSESSAAASASSSVSFHGLSVIELRALLKEKYKGHHDKITNLQKLKKPELIQLLHE
jgi:hypothetical protein